MKFGDLSLTTERYMNMFLSTFDQVPHPVCTRPNIHYEVSNDLLYDVISYRIINSWKISIL